MAVSNFDIKQFFLFYGALIALGVLYLLWRKPRRGMTLRLTKRFGGGFGSQRELPKALEHRELNVIFNYNGHSWDAFEVLGLPAGSSLERVEAAFKEASSKVDVESRPFLRAALEAIRTQKH